jgi:hypothetical protein
VSTSWHGNPQGKPGSAYPGPTKAVGWAQVWDKSAGPDLKTSGLIVSFYLKCEGNSWIVLHRKVKEFLNTTLSFSFPVVLSKLWFYVYDCNMDHFCRHPFNSSL